MWTPAPTDDVHQAIDTVETWIELVNEASHVHNGLAPVVTRYIETVRDPDEILRFVPFMAGLSNQTRLDIAATLHTILTALRQATQASACETPARTGGLRPV